MNFHRGQIWLVKPIKEKAPLRPALVLSSDEVHRIHSACIVLPIVKQKADCLATEVCVTKAESGLQDDFLVQCDTISTLAFDSFQKQIGTLEQETMSRIETVVKSALGLAGR